MRTHTPRNPSVTRSAASVSRLAAVAATLGAALLGSGCASLSASPPTEVDALYVARVEQAARRMGTSVVWLNYPQRTRTANEPAAK